MVLGSGSYTDCMHTYPKSHWSHDEAAEYHAKRMADPSWTPPKKIEAKVETVNLPDVLKNAPKELKDGAVNV